MNQSPGAFARDHGSLAPAAKRPDTLRLVDDEGVRVAGAPTFVFGTVMILSTSYAACATNSTCGVL